MNEDLRSISAARWHELYWAPDGGYPSCEELGRRFGVKGETISRALKRAGLTVRTRQEQAKIDAHAGRKPIPKPPRTGWQGRIGPAITSPERYAKKQRAGIRKAAQTRILRETRPCTWCGTPITRRPSEFRKRPNPCCCHQHAGELVRWRARFPGSARPLILARLVETVKTSGRTYTYETVERCGETLGAGEAEILAALEQLS